MKHSIPFVLILAGPLAAVLVSFGAPRAALAVSGCSKTLWRALSCSGVVWAALSGVGLLSIDFMFSELRIVARALAEAHCRPKQLGVAHNAAQQRRARQMHPEHTNPLLNKRFIITEA